MANITVVELLSDPDFVEPVVVVRNTETVGPDGMVSYTPQSFTILASIQSNTDTLVMEPDFARTSGSYEIITTFPLATASNLDKADTVLWRGCEYVVTAVGRFGNWAALAGHYEGVMTLKTISPSVGPP
jgi:hypothetical protein